MEEIPKIIFIVPYRDREQQLIFFKRHMKYILEDYPENYCKIYYIHQHDNRSFNRGAMKNIGFIMVKETYPNDYHNITLVFNDVDTMPYSKGFLNYETSCGVVKHFYGFKFALGGIVSIVGSDFEKVGGFPNFFGWSMEDNSLNNRVLKHNLIIDRTNFYPINDKNIIQFKDDVTRTINRTEFDRYLNNTKEGINSINDLKYEIDEDTGFINVSNFNTGIEEDIKNTKIYDLRNGPAPYGKISVLKRRGGNSAMNMIM
jgi:hypothetical protein